MNIFKSNLFPFVVGDSLVAGPVTLTIETVTEETVFLRGKEENKLVLRFVESEKGLILNKTNARALGKLFGGETDDWSGNRIELYSERIQAFGKTHNAVRLRPPSPG